MSTPVLALSNLGAISVRDRTPILRGVSFEVARGETRGLVGESGAGKSTVGPRLWRGLDAKAARALAFRLLDEVHIRDPDRVLRSFPHELSGGMRQRVLIAAAFALEPRLIVADEPTTALDVTVQKQILRLIRSMQSAHGTSVVFVTHDLGVVAQICDQVTLLFGGRVIEAGSTAQLLDTPVHPYTRALLEACPRYDRPNAGLRPIPEAIIADLHAEFAQSGTIR
jgi:peptide/nickel transport system ATP-binding protein